MQTGIQMSKNLMLLSPKINAFPKIGNIVGWPKTNKGPFINDVTHSGGRGFNFLRHGVDNFNF